MLIVIDKNDKIVGYKSKKECHKGEGILHRAFSIFIFNKNGKFLLQKRSKQKLLWPLFWSNSCCSHFKKGEKGSWPVKKRLQEELGFTCPLKFIDKFYYSACYKNVGCEKEITYIFVGIYDDGVVSDKKEVASYKWADWDWLKKDMKKKPDSYTPWLRLIMQKVKLT